MTSWPWHCMEFHHHPMALISFWAGSSGLPCHAVNIVNLYYVQRLKRVLGWSQSGNSRSCASRSQHLEMVCPVFLSWSGLVSGWFGACRIIGLLMAASTLPQPVRHAKRNNPPPHVASSCRSLRAVPGPKRKWPLSSDSNVTTYATAAMTTKCDNPSSVASLLRAQSWHHPANSIWII